MTDQRLEIAFLGCGQAARMHSRTLGRMDGVGLRYASRDAVRAEAWRERHGGSRAYGSYEEGLADPAVDVAFVVTPPHLHLEQTLAALEAGKHVWVEKPAFLRSGDVARVRSAAEAAGRRVMVAENYVYKPLAARLRELLRDGAIGRPRMLYVNALKEQTTGDWRDDPALAGGGALFEGGIHWLSFMASLGMDVHGVSAWRPGGGGPGAERSALLVLDYDDGAVGSLFFSWDQPSPLKGLRLSRIYGTEGTLAFESNGVAVSVFGRRRKSFSFPGFRDIAGYRAMFGDFLAALRQGREPFMTLDMAARDLRLVEAAYASMEERADARGGPAASPLSRP